MKIDKVHSNVFLLLALLVTSTLVANALASEEGQLCKLGKSQSPIALDSRQALRSELSTPTPSYQPAGVVLWNQGQTLQAQFAVSEGLMGPGDNRLWLDGVNFKLLQFHFHLPGEHPIDGKTPAMELHFVHSDATDRLAVLAVPMTSSPGAADHPGIAKLWASFPENKGERRLLAELFDPNSLLPLTRVAYRYPGSLTTHDCAESVRWTVYSEPIVISPAQLSRYKAVFPEAYARPAQPLNGRIPLRTTP